jgi:zinc protease
MRARTPGRCSACETASRLSMPTSASLPRRRFTPGTAALVVVGAVDAAARCAGGARVRRLDRRRRRGPPAGHAPRTERTTVHLVDRPGAVQSELRIGHVGVPRHHEDYYALLVMNAISAAPSPAGST